MLNVAKTKELIVDFRRTQQHQRIYTPLGINATAVERVSSYKYLGVHIRGSDLDYIDSQASASAVTLQEQRA